MTDIYREAVHVTTGLARSKDLVDDVHEALGSAATVVKEQTDAMEEVFERLAVSRARVASGCPVTHVGSQSMNHAISFLRRELANVHDEEKVGP